MFHMITNGENEIKRVLALMPDGLTAAPCGACREFMAQLMPGRYHDVEIMLDYEQGKVVTLGELNGGYNFRLPRRKLLTILYFFMIWEKAVAFELGNSRNIY